MKNNYSRFSNRWKLIEEIGYTANGRAKKPEYDKTIQMLARGWWKLEVGTEAIEWGSCRSFGHLNNGANAGQSLQCRARQKYSGFCPASTLPLSTYTFHCLKTSVA